MKTAIVFGEPIPAERAKPLYVSYYCGRCGMSVSADEASWDVGCLNCGEGARVADIEARLSELVDDIVECEREIDKAQREADVLRRHLTRLRGVPVLA